MQIIGEYQSSWDDGTEVVCPARIDVKTGLIITQARQWLVEDNDVKKLDFHRIEIDDVVFEIEGGEEEGAEPMKIKDIGPFRQSIKTLIEMA
jgi:hypothetical protein